MKTFELIDVADWCRQAADGTDLLSSKRSYLPVLPGGRRAAVKPNLVGGVSQERARAFYGSVSPNLGVPLDREVMVGGSVVANLGFAIIKDSSLLVLVRENLAITEAFGSRSWGNFQMRLWPNAHHVWNGVVKLASGEQTVSFKAYDLDTSDVMTVDEPCLYLSVRQDDRNPYHWVFETLARLACVEVVPELRRLPLLVRDPLTPFQAAFLRWMGFDQNVFVTGGRTVRAQTLFFPSVPSAPVLNETLVGWLRQRVLGGFSAGSTLPCRRVYVSRGDAANGRRVANETELAQNLEPLGFQQVVMSRLSPDAQLDIFRNAEFVVLPHGAAGTFLAFTPRECKVLELHSPKRVNNLFAALCAARGLKYSWVIGEPVNDGTDYVVTLQDVLSIVRSGLGQGDFCL